MNAQGELRNYNLKQRMSLANPSRWYNSNAPPKPTNQSSNKSPPEISNSMFTASASSGQSFAFKDRLLESNNSPDQKEKIETEKLDNMAEKATSVLLKISSVFPMDPWTDHITIDSEKVNIVIKEFFMSEQIHSVFIKEINDIFIETGPFFAKLTISHRGYRENSIEVNYLKKHDAIQARKIIQGLIIAHKEGLDVASINITELKNKIEDLGKVHQVE